MARYWAATRLHAQWSHRQGICDMFSCSYRRSQPWQGAGTGQAKWRPSEGEDTLPVRTGTSIRGYPLSQDIPWCLVYSWISMVFLNEWNLGALWICLVDIKIASFYLCKNETIPQKLLLWELCAFYVNITLITANTNWQQLPHTKLQLKGTMPGPLRTCFTWLLEKYQKVHSRVPGQE